MRRLGLAVIVASLCLPGFASAGPPLSQYAVYSATARVTIGAGSSSQAVPLAPNPLVGSGYSASPVAADGKIYLSNEDGEMLIVEAGATFKHIGTNSIGEMLMATPALSDGVMYVRGVSTLFAIGRR